MRWGWLALCGSMLSMAQNAVAAERSLHLVSRPTDTVQLESYMRAATATLPSVQQNALTKIANGNAADSRRHLALSYYLRADKTIASRWSWNDVEIEAYRRSPEYAAALAEIDKIAAHFARENPGYVLYVNTEIRSLEKQIERWHEIRSVGAAAKQLRDVAYNELTNSAYSRSPTEESLQRFVRFIVAWRANPPPTLAAPGLSLHGRGQAYDFQIHDTQGRAIATTDSATVEKVWDKQGWTRKLADVVHAASDNFAGPLQTPREPWHYEYRPKQ